MSPGLGVGSQVTSDLCTKASKTSLSIIERNMGVMHWCHFIERKIWYRVWRIYAKLLISSLSFIKEAEKTSFSWCTYLK
ncbi:hypothetical protein MKW98_030378 [Papaver atlanticum]|uniref:Uncharacterized protein n=1 Tax=Papaver atlanticum TaxID=357466 RepID=A0AAD4RZH3_9MAGN|nr:hypothetical protein MKW98_030378 [Papaver atlanticum]